MTAERNYAIFSGRMFMDDPLNQALSALAPNVEAGAARAGFERRRRGRRRWTSVAFGTTVVVGLVATAAVVRLIDDDKNGDSIITTDSSMPPVAASSEAVPSTTEQPNSTTSASSTTSPLVAPPSSVAPAASVTTTEDATLAPSAMPVTVTPFGVSSNDTSVRISESEIETSPVGTTGEVVLSYRLALGLFPLPSPAKLVPATITADGQLSVDVECSTPDCSIEPINDEFQTTIRLVVRTTEQRLTTGVHTAPFTVEYTNGTTTQFDVQFYAQPAPSSEVSDLVASSTGTPEVVQRVPGIGRFAYHAISAFDSIWIIGKNSNTVARIDSITGELLATISLDTTNSNPNRLAAGTDAVYAAGTPIVRIDPSDNSTTHIDNGVDANGIAANGTTSWASGRDGIQRIDPDGTITNLDVPDRFWFDLAYSNNTVWALDQERGGGTLLGVDADTGTTRHTVPLQLSESEIAVRIVAGDDQVIIGTDTSGGGGRTGRILVYDAITATLINSVALDSRPEGIVITDNYIWTSGAIIDRDTLTVETDNTYFGFTITRGPDGSIWGTTSLASSSTAEGVAVRWAPGDYAN